MTSASTSGFDDEKATKALRRLCNARAEITLSGFALGMKKGTEGRSLYRLDCGRRLVTRLEKTLREYLDTMDQSYADGMLKVRPYTSGMNADTHELFWLNPAMNEKILTVFEALKLTSDLMSVSDIRKFPWSNVQLQARVYDVRGKPLIMIRKASVAQVLRRPGKITLLYRDGVLEVVDEHGIVLDEGFDAFLWDGLVFVRRTAPFETFFEFYDKLEEEAEEIVRSIQTRLPIKGASELIRIARSYPAMLRKIHRISKQPYFDRITIDDVERVAKKLGRSVLVEGKGKDKKLVFDKGDRLAILKLLDDDFAQALLSETIYEIRENAKHVVVQGK